ncbi:DUF4244 domain-containing protein [Cellulomonas sp. KRMCY2]|uniref:DUF4244 domain-containing protein n=1 Tax=Cellulomonas sp. KRMCY2 TaxID=1304865 RepID=UPI001E512249|nr:DUF4244 domain-containing protein [Cellulomonas sp. KRMCY2]
MTTTNQPSAAAACRATAFQRAEPAMPEPAMPEPVMPEPVMPEPVMPEPVMPEPAMPEPVATELASTGLATAQPATTQPRSATASRPGHRVAAPAPEVPGTAPRRPAPGTVTPIRSAGRRPRLLHLVRAEPDAGMATAEYAIATVAAAGFAGLLLVILRSDEVRGLLLGIVRGALSV